MNRDSDTLELTKYEAILMIKELSGALAEIALGFVKYSVFSKPMVLKKDGRNFPSKINFLISE